MINEKHMNLIKDEFKTSYLLFKLKEKLQPFSSHQPILIHTLNTITEGDVLEYGMGWNSTPIMHTICGMQDRNLLSVETDKNWFSKFTRYESEKHTLIRLDEEELCKWEHPFFTKKYSVAFIDGAPGWARHVVLDKLKDYADYFVVHDTEEAVRNFQYTAFTYEWDFSGFKHHYHIENGGPATSLLSNLDEINKNLLTIFDGQ